jgi:hypothetical protein
MKSIMLTTGMLLVILVLSPQKTIFAFDQNPDRFPSIGARLIAGGDFGDNTFTNGPKQNFSRMDFGVDLDGRVPLTEAVTVSAGILVETFEDKYDETAALNGSKLNATRIAGSVGMRYYFH